MEKRRFFVWCWAIVDILISKEPLDSATIFPRKHRATEIVLFVGGLQEEISIIWSCSRCAASCYAQRRWFSFSFLFLLPSPLPSLPEATFGRGMTKRTASCTRPRRCNNSLCSCELMLLLFSGSNAPPADRLAAQRLPLLSRDAEDSESDAFSFSRYTIPASKWFIFDFFFKGNFYFFRDICEFRGNLKAEKCTEPGVIDETM